MSSAPIDWQVHLYHDRMWQMSKILFILLQLVNFWNGYERFIGSQYNHLNKQDIDSFSGIGNAFSMGLELEEADIENSDFPPGCFHPVDDSLAFHPHVDPWDF